MSIPYHANKRGGHSHDVCRQKWSPKEQKVNAEQKYGLAVADDVVRDGGSFADKKEDRDIDAERKSAGEKDGTDATHGGDKVED